MRDSMFVKSTSEALMAATILIVVGFQILLIGLLADLIAFNRQISEETIYRVRKLEATFDEHDRRLRDTPAEEYKL